MKRVIISSQSNDEAFDNMRNEIKDSINAELDRIGKGNDWNYVKSVYYQDRQEGNILLYTILEGDWTRFHKEYSKGNARFKDICPNLDSILSSYGYDFIKQYKRYAPGPEVTLFYVLISKQNKVM